MFVISMVFYLLTRIVGYSVSLGISCSTRKLARTFQVLKKKDRIYSHSIRHSTSIKLHTGIRACVTTVILR
jgi:CHASE3 domain sensor protein